MRLSSLLSSLGAASTAIAANESVPLSLKASLEPINSTHLRASIVNTYNEQIGILKWNNHFSNQKSGHGSFQVTHTKANGTVQSLRRGAGMGQYLFGDMDPSHFYNISAKGLYTEVFDLTRLFYIPFTAEYNVTLSLQSQAILQNNGTDLNQELEAAGRSLRNLPFISIESGQISMNLEATTSLTKHKRDSIGTCASQSSVNSTVDTARHNANLLARFGQQANNNDLWLLYFNDTSHSQTGRVYNVYSSITNYGVNGNFQGIQEYCDPGGIDTECVGEGNTIAYNLPGDDGSTSEVVFCEAWFNLPATDICDFPSQNNQDMADKGGAFLHELTHSPQLVGFDDIFDGTKCYSWDCITGAAQGTNGQPSPWLIANTYEFYAYAARALATSSCNNDEHQVTNTELGGIVGG